MAYITFTVSGNYASLSPGSNVQGTVVFTPNLAYGSLAHGNTGGVSTGVLRAPVTALIKNGLLAPASSVATAVTLYANDPQFNLASALQYTVTFVNLLVDGKTVGIDPFTFNAPSTSVNIDLVVQSPASSSTTTPIVSITTSQISDANTYTRGLLTTPVDAATARTYLGIASGMEWEEYVNFAAFPGTGNTALEYLAQDTGKLFRWTGAAYLQISDKNAVGLGNVDNTSDATKNTAVAALTNKDLTSGTNAFPTFNQSTTGSAAKWTTARTLAGNSADGSANVPFANTFIVQGTADAGLSAAQFLGALATGILKNTTTTGILSIAAAGTDYVAPGGALGTPASGTLTNCTGLPVAGVASSTLTALGVGSLQLGSATDTTLSRVSAGILAVAGVTVPTVSSTNTLTNKAITARTNSVASSATPAINTDTTDQFNITALAVPITSMSSSLTGAPTDGEKLRIRFKDNGTAQTITWGASFVSGGVTLLATTVANKTHIVEVAWDGIANKWACVRSDATGY